MNVSSVSATTPAAVSNPAAAPPGGFARLLTQFLGDASTQQTRAEQAVSNLASGRADSVHNVMLAMAKADLSFHLVLEIRNRLSEAYQDIMRMQV